MEEAQTSLINKEDKQDEENRQVRHNQPAGIDSNLNTSLNHSDEMFKIESNLANAQNEKLEHKQHAQGENKILEMTSGN